MDLYTTHRRLPIHHSNGLILPLPMHIPTANYAFSPSIINSSRYPAIPASSLMQSRQFDPFYYSNNNSMFTPVIPSNIAQHQYLKLDSIANAYPASFLNAPPQTIASLAHQQRPVNESVKTATAATTINKEDEVTSSEEAKLPATDDKPTYIQSSFIGIAGSLEQEGFFESPTKLLYLAIKWAKSMPSFMQIPLKDQTILLENSWAELFILIAAQYGGLVIESKR